MSRATRRVAERLEGLRPESDYLDAVKSRVNPRMSGLVGLEQELAREAACSLGRQGARLERAFAALRELEQAFAREPSEAIALAHRAQRLEAERALWNLKIQREALGLRNHRELDRRYPLPASLRFMG